MTLYSLGANAILTNWFLLKLDTFYQHIPPLHANQSWPVVLIWRNLGIPDSTINFHQFCYKWKLSLAAQIYQLHECMISVFLTIITQTIDMAYAT